MKYRIGTDLTHHGTDHTRERAFLLDYSPSMEVGGKLPDCDSFGVIGATVLDNFDVKQPESSVDTTILNNLI